METTSKHALSTARRLVREAHAEYRSARKLVLLPWKSVRMREERIYAALDKRFWYYEAMRRLAAAGSKAVVAHGGRWSPKALVRNGFDPRGA